ncbi:hypothetical protein ACVWZD_004985 [Streptomyces sp. TE3672]
MNRKMALPVPEAVATVDGTFWWGCLPVLCDSDPTVVDLMVREPRRT